MPKNKLKKYARVRQLPNVTFAGCGVSPAPGSYPWDAERFAGMGIVLELGCGKGEHTLAFAADNPGKLFVGVDCKSHRICVGAENALNQGFSNIQFLHARIERIREIFMPYSISTIWLTFPDPYPKTQTLKFRLTAEPFLKSYAYLLVPGGTIHLKTDSDMLFNFTRATVEAFGGHILDAIDDIDTVHEGGPGAVHVVSAYEKGAREQGETIKYLAFNLN
jgi:tRNA (guanine-N7-)-methyltransferase